MRLVSLITSSIRLSTNRSLSLGPFQTPNFRFAEPNWNQGRAKLFRPAELIHTPISIQAELNSKAKNAYFGASACKIRYNN